MPTWESCLDPLLGNQKHDVPIRAKCMLGWGCHCATEFVAAFRGNMTPRHSVHISTSRVHPVKRYILLLNKVEGHLYIKTDFELLEARVSQRVSEVSEVFSGRFELYGKVPERCAV
jgi:hypothetical protein